MPTARYNWQCRQQTIVLGPRTLVMGIVNVTPDSFSDGGQFFDPERAISHALKMLHDGADILDFGAESTRPGAQPVSPEEQLRRLAPVIQQIRTQTQALISIDTCSSIVAREMLKLGVDIINDISALRVDEALGEVVARYRAGLVLMHMLGMPATMQVNPVYTDVVKEVKEFLHERMDYAQRCGVPAECIVLDPGIGFGKSVEHNLRLIAHAGELGELGRPVLSGVSRKSFIGRILGLEAHERLEGTLAAVAASVLNGARIVRVHDVKETRRAIDVLDAIRMQE